MSKKNKVIKKMIKCGYAKYQPDNMITLTSGMKSPYYFNIKNALLDPYTTIPLQDLLRDELEEYWDFDKSGNPKYFFDSIGGPANASYILIGILNGGLFNDLYPAPSFILRKDRKDHGLQNIIDGMPPEKGNKVLVIDDVITTGGSLLSTLKLIEDNEAEVYRILCIVDREANGNKEVDKISKYREKGLVSSIFKMSDFNFEK